MGALPTLTSPEPPAAEQPSSVAARHWLYGSLGACLLTLAAAVLYPASLPALERRVAGLYGQHEAWRRALMSERLGGYASLLWLISASLGGFCLAVQERGRLNQLLRRLASRLGRAAPLLIALLALGVVALDYVFSTREWVRLGRPCWDNYCYYAELLSKWLAGAKVTPRLLAFMHEDYHSNSPVGPLLVACLKLATGLDTIDAYRACVFLATLGSVALLWRSLEGLVAARRQEAVAALLLFGSHFIVVRSSFFPQTDAFVLLWTTALVLLAARRSEAPRGWHGPACVLLLVTGLFVKLSFLPALALLPAWRLTTDLASRRRLDAIGLARDIFFYSLLPLAVFLLVQWRLGLLPLYRVEMSAIAGSDSSVPFVAMSVVHAGAVLAPLAWLGRRRLTPREAPLVAWIVLYLAALWLSRASGWDRFYLVVLTPLTLLAAHGLAVVREELGAGPLWVGVLLVAALHYAALGLRLYY